MELAEIWRYPVKSMLGEPLEQADVGPGGIQGDRRWAVVDAGTGVSLSAKRYPDLLRCEAWTSDGQVMVRLPNGREDRVDSAGVGRDLSELLQRKVTTRSADAAGTIQHEFPTATTEGTGEPYLHKTAMDAFFDSVTLHLLTSATMDELQRLLPASTIQRARFRPNFLVRTDATGFVENDWVKKDITLGTLRCQVVDDTRRCIMVALGQGDLPRDMDVIRTVLKRNERRSGVALKAVGSGVVRCGARVEVVG